MTGPPHGHPTGQDHPSGRVHRGSLDLGQAAAVSFHSRGPRMQHSCALQGRYSGSLPWDRKVPCLRHAGASPVPYQQSRSRHCHTEQILMSRPAIFSPGSPGHCPGTAKVPSLRHRSPAHTPTWGYSPPPHTSTRLCTDTEGEEETSPRI